MPHSNSEKEAETSARPFSVRESDRGGRDDDEETEAPAEITTGLLEAAPQVTLTQGIEDAEPSPPNGGEGNELPRPSRYQPNDLVEQSYSEVVTFSCIGSPLPSDLRPGYEILSVQKTRGSYGSGEERYVVIQAKRKA
jgi:hypothetical protein